MNVERMGDHRGFYQLCMDGDIEGVQAAIDNGADVNEEIFFWGTTGLMWALNNSHNHVVKLLVQHPQIDINKVDLNGGSALHWAVGNDNHEGLAALLAQQNLPTINQKDNGGWTPIMKAVACKSVNCFQLLLTNPQVDLDTRDGYQRNPKEIRR